MPRVSDRQKSLRFVKRKLEWNIATEKSSSDNDSDESESSKSSGFLMDNSSNSDTESDTNLSDSESDYGEDPLDLSGHPGDLFELNFVMHHTRYFVEREITPKSRDFCRNYFDDLSPRLFRQMVRMDKPTFFALVDLIENNAVFVNNSWHQQAPIEWQLAVTLDWLGHNGNGACLTHMIPTWGVSNGSLLNFTNRCFIALEVALKDFLKWPNAAERHAIQLEFSKLGFPVCVGLIDGSALPLAQRPKLSGECYWDRKSKYSVNAQVVCDHRRKIIYLFTGMAGSCADLTCLKKSRLWSRLSDGVGFDDGQYLIGDSGYVALPHLVAAYKRGDTSQDKEDFNHCIAKARVTNEHCIGVLKSRWHSLKEIRIQLNEKKDSVHMVKWIGLCVRLHNFVIAQNDLWSDDDQAIILDQNEVEVEDHTVTRPQLVGSRLLARVMEHALAHNRLPGGCLHPYV